MTIKSDLIESALPGRLQAVVAFWRTGADLRASFPKNTFYRYRREILNTCGIDIAVPPLDLRPSPRRL